MSRGHAAAPARLVAVGDSFSCGVGVGVEISAAETWVGLLAAALDLDLEMLAVPGVASAEALRDQVPVARACPGKIATVLVGLNDILRAAFVPEQTRASVHTITGELCAAYPVVLLVRLHDAVALLPLPDVIRRRYVARIAAVNLALDGAAAAHEHAVLLDLAAVPALGRRCAWAVDRIHPSRYGHHAVADAALAALCKGGVTAAREATPRVAVLPEQPPRLLDEIRWFLRSAAPWLARRLPAVLFGRAPSDKPVQRRPLVELGTGKPLGGRGASRGEQLVHR